MEINERINQEKLNNTNFAALLEEIVTRDLNNEFGCGQIDASYNVSTFLYEKGLLNLTKEEHADYQRNGTI